MRCRGRSCRGLLRRPGARTCPACSHSSRRLLLLFLLLLLLRGRAHGYPLHLRVQPLEVLWGQRGVLQSACA